VSFTLNCTLVRDGTGAVLVDTGVGQIWLPYRELISVERGMFGALRIQMPAWLAREKGLKTMADERQGVLL
jgi:hypothetical protein